MLKYMIKIPKDEIYYFLILIIMLLRFSYNHDIGIVVRRCFWPFYTIFNGLFANVYLLMLFGLFANVDKFEIYFDAKCLYPVQCIVYALNLMLF